MKQADVAKLDKVFGPVVPAIEQVSNWRKHKTPSLEPVRWDHSPVIKKTKGVEREFFLIGALAEALGRKAVTIRSWEDHKGFPVPNAKTKPPAPSNNGRLTAGRRLYTRAEIEAAVAAAKATGVYDPTDSPNWAEFVRLVKMAWAALRKPI